MRLKTASTVSHKLTSSSIALTCLRKQNNKRDHQFLPASPIPIPTYIPRKLSRSCSHPEINHHLTRGHTIKRSCSANSDEIFDNSLDLDLSEDDEKKMDDDDINNTACTVFKTNPNPMGDQRRSEGTNLNSCSNFSPARPEEYGVEYYRTDLLYQLHLSQDPNNPLLLANYAQFLLLVAHDFDRAEECFKRAIETQLPDAEMLSQYAKFLWVVREDLWGAEERYLQAVEADPDNPYHTANYARFLWTTGGKETCFPLSTPNSSYNSKASTNL